MGSTNSKTLFQTVGNVDISSESMDAVHALLEAFWQSLEAGLVCLPDDTWRALFDSSVIEIAANVVRHAYVTPAEDPKLLITLRCFPDHLEAVLRDFGDPYESDQVMQPPDMTGALESPDLDHGWGLQIAYAAVDRIDYERSPDGYNFWRIGKQLPTC